MLAGTQLVMGVPEDHLLARCWNGDVEAFGRIYAEYEQGVFRHAYRLLGSHEDALDACQETFVKAFHAMRSFRGDCSLRVWLLRICTNQCRNQLRTRLRRREISLEQAGESSSAQAPSADPALLFERQQLAGIIQLALDRLPAPHREIIVLRDLEELTPAEVAAVLGCSVASVPVKLFRARKRLKEQVRRLTPDQE
jgi:RNA polymerase sigma-70 factor, ECF subfamily